MSAASKFNTAVIPASRDEVWLRRHEEYAQRAKAGGIDVLFIGDSLTEWWLDPARGKAEWERCFGGWRTANFGISADRTQHLLWRLRHGEGQGYAPQAIVLLVGTNNTGLENDGRTPRNTVDETLAGIRAVLDELRDCFPEAKILHFALFPRGEKDSLNRRQVEAINRALAGWPREESTRLVDIGSRFLDGNGDILEDLMPDLLHLSAQGYRIWSAAIQDAMRDPCARPRSSDFQAVGRA